jgi:hypothetical protein
MTNKEPFMNKLSSLSPSANASPIKVTPLALSLLAATAIVAFAGTAQAQTAAPGFSISVFANGPAGTSNADSVEVVGNNVFVGYGNTAAKTGGSGTSTIAEFSRSGTLLQSTTVDGHNDGLRYNAATNQLWAIQNEDANANLVLINPGNLAKSAPMSIASVNGGGGFDDAAFVGGKAYLSASNPANSPNTGVAIVLATPGATTVSTTPVLAGNSSATPLNAGAPSTLNLQDPDSLSITMDGRVVLTSQADGQLVFVKNIGTASQSVGVLQLTNAMVDDTAFGGTSNSTLLVADKTTDKVYAVTGDFNSDNGYSAAQDSNGLNGSIGTFNANTYGDGTLTPIVTGLGNPAGEAFLSPAVPEPATWGLMIIGFAGVGFMAYCRKSKPALMAV